MNLNDCDGVCHSCFARDVDEGVWEILGRNKDIEEEHGLLESDCLALFRHLEDEKIKRESVLKIEIEKHKFFNHRYLK